MKGVSAVKYGRTIKLGAWDEQNLIDDVEVKLKLKRCGCIAAVMCCVGFEKIVRVTVCAIV